jgi:hypothetical protein
MSYIMHDTWQSKMWICIETWQFEKPHIDDTWMKVSMDELIVDESVDKRWHHIMPYCNQRWNVKMTSGLYLAICRDGHFYQWSYWQLVKITSQIGQKAIGKKNTSQKSRVQIDLSKMALWSSWTWSELGTFWLIFGVKKAMFSCLG